MGDWATQFERVSFRSLDLVCTCGGHTLAAGCRDRAVLFCGEKFENVSLFFFFEYAISLPY